MDTVVNILLGLPGVIVPFLLYRAVGRGAQRVSGGFVMSHATEIKGFWGLLSVGLSGFIIWGIQFEMNHTAGALRTFTLIFFLGVVPCCWCFFRALTGRILLTDSAIERVGKRRPIERIAWHEVRRVKCGGLQLLYLVEGIQGNKIYVSAVLQGQRAFAEHILEHVPEEHLHGAHVLKRMLER